MIQRRFPSVSPPELPESPFNRLISAIFAVFQQIEIEESLEPKHGPVLRLFGVNAKGNSVLAYVHGFKPYFYIAAPAGFLNKDLEPFKDSINVGDMLVSAIRRS